MSSDDQVPITELSRALDEIYELRSLLAYEAAVREADLALASYPKSRRQVAEWSVLRMREAAQGRGAGLQFITPRALREARARAGMEGLTRSMWQAEMERRRRS